MYREEEPRVGLPVCLGEHGWQYRWVREGIWEKDEVSGWVQGGGECRSGVEVWII